MGSSVNYYSCQSIKLKTNNKLYLNDIAILDNVSSVNVLYTTIPKASTSLKVTKKSSTSMKVSYKKSSGATGYEIVYSTSKSFSSSKTKTITGTSKTITGLKKNKTYYVKVRTYQTINGKKVYSSYTSVKTVKLK